MSENQNPEQKARDTKNRLHLRQANAVTNFAARLPDAQSDLARATLKDPYLFDFLGLGDEAHERDIEEALIHHITRFLLELGAGFAFVGRQFKLDVGGDEFFIDLLFYHIRLKCYVVAELKATAFKPEHAGQLNFYLSAVDAQIKAPDDLAAYDFHETFYGNEIVAGMRRFALMNMFLHNIGEIDGDSMVSPNDALWWPRAANASTMCWRIRRSARRAR